MCKTLKIAAFFFLHWMNSLFYQDAIKEPNSDLARTVFPLIRNLEISAQPLTSFLLAGRLLITAQQIKYNKHSPQKSRQNQSCCLPIHTAAEHFS